MKLLKLPREIWQIILEIKFKAFEKYRHEYISGLFENCIQLMLVAIEEKYGPDIGVKTLTWYIWNESLSPCSSRDYTVEFTTTVEFTPNTITSRYEWSTKRTNTYNELVCCENKIRKLCLENFRITNSVFMMYQVIGVKGLILHIVDKDFVIVLFSDGSIL